MVNYNTTSLAADALRSLRARTGTEGIEVIVVDNASRDFDPAVLTAVWPEAHVIVSGDNLGFGRANNLGAARAGGDHLWLLNTDTLVPSDSDPWSLVDFLDAHDDYAAVLPLLTDAEGTVQPWQTGHFPSLWRMALNPAARAAARVAPTLRGRLGFVDTNFAPVVAADVDQVVAAAVVVRRSAFEQVGGFSPQYFFFLEDTDLCRKLRYAGWRIRWQPATTMVHLWGGSVADPVARQRMFFAAQDLYFRAWHSPVEARALRVMRLPLGLAARIRRRRDRQVTEPARS